MCSRSGTGHFLSFFKQMKGMKWDEGDHAFNVRGYPGRAAACRARIPFISFHPLHFLQKNTFSRAISAMHVGYDTRILLGSVRDGGQPAGFNTEEE